MAGIKGLPVDYSVWYKPVNSKEWKMTKVSTKKALEATISNLLPGIVIFCVNSVSIILGNFKYKRNLHVARFIFINSLERVISNCY